MATRKIALSNGMSALVDEEDYFVLSGYRWYYSIGYAMRQVQKDYVKTTIMMHNVIAKRMGFDLADQEVDHDNRVGTDNRRVNLNIGSHSANMVNRNKQRNNTSGHRGVTWFKKTQKWKVEICKDRVNHYVGYFDEWDAAVSARKAAEVKYFGKEIAD